MKTFNEFPAPTRTRPSLSSDALRALGVTKPPKVKAPPDRPCDNCPPMKLTTQLVAEAFRISGKKNIPTSRQVNSLVELEREHKTIRGQLQSVTSDAARKSWTVQMTALPWRLSEKADDKIQAVEVWTCDEIVNATMIRRRSLKSSLRAVTVRALPICQDIISHIEAAARIAAAKIETEEKARAKSFGIEFFPSTVLIAMHQLSWRLSMKMDGWVPSSAPSQMLAALPLDWKLSAWALQNSTEI